MINDSHDYLTVSELNTLIKEVINMGFPRSLWICGEIQGFDRNRGKKHVFFELCEKDAESESIVARTQMVIFSGRRDYINDILKGANNAFELKDDIEVKFLCKIDFYPPHGAVRLIVESIDPSYTLGKIAQAKQQLIKLLKEKGILNKNKQCAMPPVPLHIGLITAEDSAAYNDFLSELRLSGYHFRVYFKAALMQGKAAEDDVCRALRTLSGDTHLDAVVITRGGGSVADLSCFDSEKIARQISKMRIPVLSGIGHEINITVTDLCAHTYQKTPTAIARYLVGCVENFLSMLEDRLHELDELTRGVVNNEKDKLKGSAHRLLSCMTAYLKGHDNQLLRYNEALRREPLRILKSETDRIGLQKDFLNKSASNMLKNVFTKVRNYERIIEVASPKNVLKKGFSLTRNEQGRLIKSAGAVRHSEVIVSELFKGCLISRVEKVNQGNQAKEGSKIIG